jgi:hypothetical protein
VAPRRDPGACAVGPGQIRGTRTDAGHHGCQFAGAVSLPENLWIIGTLNIAECTIALLDAALRRRFHVVAFSPNEPPIARLLRRWLRRHRSNPEWLADVVDRANAQLGDTDLAIGPSHYLVTISMRSGST